MSKTGHNSGGIAADHLRSFISRIERLNDEKAALVNDIREVFKEAAMTGFDQKALRALVKERAQDRQKAAELAEILDLYRVAMGDLDESQMADADAE